MSCTTDRREQVTALADAVECDRRVIATDVVDPATEPTDLWAVELTLEPGSGGLPEALLREIAHGGLTVRDVSSRGVYWHALVTV